MRPAWVSFSFAVLPSCRSVPSELPELSSASCPCGCAALPVGLLLRGQLQQALPSCAFCVTTSRPPSAPDSTDLLCCLCLFCVLSLLRPVVAICLHPGVPSPQLDQVLLVLEVIARGQHVGNPLETPLDCLYVLCPPRTFGFLLVERSEF